MRNHLLQYCLLIRLHRPVGIFLLLWPVLWALWIASNGLPQQIVFFVFVCGSILLRSAGCALNDYADRKLDPLVARTRDRPLANGSLRPFEALLIAGILLICAFMLVLNLNTATIAMSFIALLLAGLYPYMKRWIVIPQAFLGIAFGCGIPMAWVAQNESFPPLSIWLLYLACICWSIAYDTIYALVDRADDQRAGIKSSAIFFNKYDLLAIGFFHFAFLGLLAWVGQIIKAGLPFYSGLLVAVFMIVYQLFLVSKRTPENYFAAFNANAWLGGVVFVGLFIDFLPSFAQ